MPIFQVLSTKSTHAHFFPHQSLPGEKLKELLEWVLFWFLDWFCFFFSFGIGWKLQRSQREAEGQTAPVKFNSHQGFPIPGQRFHL